MRCDKGGLAAAVCAGRLRAPWLRAPWSRALCGGLLWGVVGCATTPPVSPERELANQMARACPDASNIVGTGTSSTALADAEQQARTEVARRIASRLEAELSVQQREVVAASGGNMQGNYEEERRNRVVEMTTFAHADLIRTTAMPQRPDGSFMAVACLSRAAAGERLHGDLKAVAERVFAAQARAQLAATHNDRAAFASAWQEFLDAFAATRPVLLQLRVVLQEPASEEADFAERRRELARQAESLREGLAFHLDVDADKLPRASRDRLRSTLEQALVLMAPVVDKRTCGAGASSSAVAVVAVVEPNCRRGTLGHSCQPLLTASLKDCRGTAAAVTGVLVEEALSGADPNQAGRALSRALEPVNAASLHQVLRRLVARLVPLEPDVSGVTTSPAGTTGSAQARRKR